MAQINPERVLADFRDDLVKAAATVEEATEDANLMDETAATIEVPEGDSPEAQREARRKELIASLAVRKSNLAQRRADRIAADEDMAVTYARAKGIKYEPVIKASQNGQ